MLNNEIVSLLKYIVLFAWLFFIFSLFIHIITFKVYLGCYTNESTGIRSTYNPIYGHPIYQICSLIYWSSYLQLAKWKNRSVVSFWPIFLCKFAKIVMRPIFFDFLVFKMAQMVMNSISIVSKMAQLVMLSIFSSSPFFQFQIGWP